MTRLPLSPWTKSPSLNNDGGGSASGNGGGKVIHNDRGGGSGANEVNDYCGEKNRGFHRSPMLPTTGHVRSIRSSWERSTPSPRRRSQTLRPRQSWRGLGALPNELKGEEGKEEAADRRQRRW